MKKMFGKKIKRISAFVLSMMIFVTSVPFQTAAEDTDDVKADAKEVESISVRAESELYEGVSSSKAYSYNSETGKDNLEYDHYNLYYSDIVLTIHYKDGSEARYDDYDVYENTGYELIVSDPQSYENQWGIGTHTVSAEYRGLKTEFEITIVENPVDHFTVSAGRALVEKVDIFSRKLNNDNYDIYNLSRADIELTVYKKDGSVSNVSPVFGGIGGPNFKRYLYAFVTDGQSEDNQWGVGKHKVVVEYMGLSAECEVEVAENPNPIKSITVTPKKALKENIDGYSESDHFIYYIENADLEIEIVYENGDRAVYGYQELYNKTGYSLEIYADQYQNPFVLGKNKVDAYLMGVDIEFDVEVEAFDNNISDVIITAGKALIENYDGWQYYGDRFIYEISNADLTVSIYYKNGTELTCKANELYGKTGYQLNIINSQYKEPFAIGKNKVSAMYMGFKAEFYVEVVENPVSGVAITAGKSLMAGDNNISNADITVTVYYKNGTELTCKEYELYEKTGYGLSFNNVGDLSIGKNVIQASYLGITTNFEVEVIESPVASVTVTAGKTLLCGNNNVHDADLSVTINYKDGTTATYKEGELYEKTGYYLELIFSGDTFVGLNKFTASYMGVKTEFYVEVVENPVAGITITAGKTLVYGDNNISGADLTVTVYYKDGTELTCKDYELYDKTGYYLNFINMVDLSVGKNVIQVSYLGIITEFEVEVVENKVESVTVTAGKTLLENYDGAGNPFNYFISNADLTVTIYYKDGTKLTCKDYELYDLTGYGLSINGTAYLSVGKNTVRASYVGVETEFEVEVVANPVESVTVAVGKTLLENNAGHYNISDAELTVTIHYKDGTEAEYRDFELGYKTGYWFNVITNQDETPLTVGKNTIRASYMGVETEFEIEIVENPVSSVTVTAGKTLILGNNNILDAELSVTINYKNGTTATYKENELYENTGYYLNIVWGSNLSAGLNKITAYYMEIETEFYIEVVESTVSGLKVTQGKALAKNNMGVYNISDAELSVTIYYKDGTEATYKESELLEKTGYSLNVQHTFFNVGKNKVTAEYMNFEVEFEIVVVLGTIDRISIVPQYKLYENIDGYGSDPFIYDVEYSNPIITIYYSNGRTAEYTANNIMMTGYDIDFHEDMQKSEPWGLGAHTVTAEYGGYTVEFEVEVVPDPVDSVSAVTTKKLIKQEDGRHYSIYEAGVLITIKYKDGTEVTYTPTEIYDETGRNFYINSDQSTHPFVVGKNKVLGTYMGRQVEFYVEVIEREVEIKNISVSAERTLFENVNGAYEGDTFIYRLNDANINITIYYEDGTQKSYKYSEIYDETGYSLNIQDYQSTDPWGVGVHTVAAEYRDCMTTFDILVVSVVRGDSDGDGIIGAADAIRFERYLVGWKGYADDIRITASMDIDKDGRVTGWDSIMLKRYLAGWDVEIGD